MLCKEWPVSAKNTAQRKRAHLSSLQRRLPQDSYTQPSIAPRAISRDYVSSSLARRSSSLCNDGEMNDEPRQGGRDSRQLTDYRCTTAPSMQANAGDVHCFASPGQVPQMDPRLRASWDSVGFDQRKAFCPSPSALKVVLQTLEVGGKQVFPGHTDQIHKHQPMITPPKHNRVYMDIKQPNTPLERAGTRPETWPSGMNLHTRQSLQSLRAESNSQPCQSHIQLVRRAQDETSSDSILHHLEHSDRSSKPSKQAMTAGDERLAHCTQEFLEAVADISDGCAPNYLNKPSIGRSQRAVSRIQISTPDISDDVRSTANYLVSQEPSDEQYMATCTNMHEWPNLQKHPQDPSTREKLSVPATSLTASELRSLMTLEQKAEYVPEHRWTLRPTTGKFATPILSRNRGHTTRSNNFMTDPNGLLSTNPLTGRGATRCYRRP